MPSESTLHPPPANENSALSIAGAPIVDRFPYRVAKRAIDLAAASLGLLALAPLLFLLGLLIKLTSRGPVCYTWRVVGRGGVPFRSYKFRTMVQDADRLKPGLLHQNEMEGPVFKIKNDPRITPVGRILRKFSLDELPQLWSVLKGDMSLVGPRPPLHEEWQQFQPWQRCKLSVKPGITCLWQISGRNDIRDFDDWVRLDLEYIDHWSLALDLQILARTIPAVLKGTGR